MPQRTVWKTSVIAISLLGLAACLDREAPLAPDGSPDPDPSTRLETQVSCIASVSQGSVACARPAGDGDQALIIGGQGQYVLLTSSDVQVLADTFSFNVTVQNLIHQAMGTVDGVTADPAGIRVFFSREPTVTSGTGEIRVDNADGRDIFNASDRPYYQYPGLLRHNETTAPRNWRFLFDAGVDTFEFTVYVWTEVQHESSWIDLSANASYVGVNDVVQLNAVLRDARGNELDGEIAWSSDNTALATVDSAGVLRVQGNVVGFVNISATSGAFTSEWTIGICGGLVAPGFSRIYTTNSAARLCVVDDNAGSEYVLVPVNVSQGGPIELTTSASGVGTITGPPNPALLPDRGVSFLRAASATVADLHERGSVRRTGGGPLAPGAPSFAIEPGVPTAGVTVWDLNVAAGCAESIETRTGRVTVVGEHAIIVVDTLNPEVEAGFYEGIADEIDTSIALTVYHNFNGTEYGEPTDIDANGRVVYFFSTAVNAQLDPYSTGEYAYFAPRDLEPVAKCQGSNQGEIIYLVAPDPEGTATPEPVEEETVADQAARAIAHELQHLVNRSHRLAAGHDSEEAWLDEAMSRAAEELVFYVQSGLLPRQNLTSSDLMSGVRADVFRRLLFVNLITLGQWLSAPEVTGPADPNPTPASGGAAWAFLRYALDRAAPPAEHQNILTRLVRAPQTGTANLAASLPGDVGAYLRDFATAMYVDDAGFSVEGALQTRSWHFRSIFGGSAYPLAATALADGVALTRTYSEGGGAAYIRFSVPAGETVTVSNSVDGGAPPAAMQFRLVRTR